MRDEIEKRKAIIRYKQARKERNEDLYESTSLKRQELMVPLSLFIEDLRSAGIFILVGNEYKMVDIYNIGISPLKYYLQLGNHSLTIEPMYSNYEQYYYKCESTKFPKYNTNAFIFDAVKDYLFTVIAMLDIEIQEEKGYKYEIPKEPEVRNKPSTGFVTDIKTSEAKTDPINIKPGTTSLDDNRGGNKPSKYSLSNLWNTIWSHYRLKKN